MALETIKIRGLEDRQRLRAISVIACVLQLRGRHQPPSSHSLIRHQARGRAACVEHRLDGEDHTNAQPTPVPGLP